MGSDAFASLRTATPYEGDIGYIDFFYAFIDDNNNVFGNWRDTQQAACDDGTIDHYVLRDRLGASEPVSDCGDPRNHYILKFEIGK
ncbi:hypothetical protein [Sinorhizobium meliloti]|uniref:hypothetical protein n=1 Tax=Rhizobium meliloti TaxID=382 RepID=UPI001294F0D6|nr:hypothetical protein [Sinorhizobium meliloti]MQX28873.1 hypothetical protein [Sinorhizobium meliloti]